MSWISKVWHKTKHGIAKVATPVLGAVGTYFGGAAGGAIGAKVGNMLGNYIDKNYYSSSSPEITSPSPAVVPPPTTPGFVGSNPVSISSSVYMPKTGTHDFGTILPNGRVVNNEFDDEIYGNNPAYRGQSRGSSAMPLLFGVGALMLLSD